MEREARAVLPRTAKPKNRTARRYNLPARRIRKQCTNRHLFRLAYRYVTPRTPPNHLFPSTHSAIMMSMHDKQQKKTRRASMFWVGFGSVRRTTKPHYCGLYYLSRNARSPQQQPPASLANPPALPEKFVTPRADLIAFPVPLRSCQALPEEQHTEQDACRCQSCCLRYRGSGIPHR